ncbi:MAG: recombination protein RecR [Ignavibacteriae bacterium]|nr:recombination protein RecR [Ignavibacteriota bacterium]MCB9242318.1 recombination protein RecR [Ignavibacteriales bacterium]
MINSSDSLEELIQELSKLPQIGRKTAQRLAMYIIKQPKSEVEKFANALVNTKRLIKFCNVCCNITEDERCRICSSDRRDRTTICIVEEPHDVYAIEKTNEYKGLYHVLHGRISPLEGIGPADIRIKELLHRMGGDGVPDVEEVILALNPNVEGETTVLYITKLLKPLGIRVTRIARGIPIGADLEFADEVTLAKAIEGRVNA